MAATLAISSNSTVSTYGAASAPGLVDPAAADLEQIEGFESRYGPRKVLGAGGMGEVLLCRDAHVGRDVALKVILPHLVAIPQARARFLREARVQGQLEHPEIVPVYDLGIGPNDQAFFTMKRVRGRTLEKVLEQLACGDSETTAELSRRKLLSLISRLCLAVDYAHSRGVVHRDLKPANIMLGDFGEVYVLDWGVAKYLGDEPSMHETELPEPPQKSGPPPRSGDSERPGLRLTGGGPRLRSGTSVETAIGEMYGTPGYMSPEQIDGIIPVDGRSDVYGLGAILFEVLAFERLHQADTAEEMLTATLKGVESRPTVRVPDRELPPELDAVIQKATATNLGDRYASARELSEAIESYLDGARDLQLRRDLAEDHAARADRLIERALSVGPDARQARADAMSEVGSALALDPTNRSATQSMVRLLTELPEEMPPDAAEALVESTQEQDRVAARGAVTIYLGSALLYGALILWLGLRDEWWAVVTMAGFVMAALLSYLDSKSTGTRYEYGVLLGSLIGILGCSRMLGPLIVVPTIALGNTMGFALTPRKRRRILFIAAGCCSFLVPLALEWLGVLSPSYRFADGLMTVLPQMHELPPTPTLVAMISISVLSTIGASLFVGETRDALATAERKLHLHSWQLRQMLPTQPLSRRDPD